MDSLIYSLILMTINSLILMTIKNCKLKEWRQCFAHLSKKAQVTLLIKICPLSAVVNSNIICCCKLCHIFLFRTTWLIDWLNRVLCHIMWQNHLTISSKLGTNHPFMKGIHVCLMKSHALHSEKSPYPEPLGHFHPNLPQSIL